MEQDPPSAPDLLEKAADLIFTVGHVKDMYFHTDMAGNELGYCATGALNKATWGDADGLGRCDPLDSEYKNALHMESVKAHAMAVIQLRKLPGATDTSYLTEWNDADERTPEQVIDLLREAAKALRNGEVVLTQSGFPLLT